MSKPTFFSTQEEFREWLAKNYDKQTELIVGYYKVKTGLPSMTWSQSVDQALCFGWIDGIRRRIDEKSYSIRFTPRRGDSIWSAVNIKKVAELKKIGLMKDAGLKAFGRRSEKKSKIYAYEKSIKKLDIKYEKQLKAHKLAWEFFDKQAPSYKKQIVNWIMSAKQEKTRLSRLQKTIRMSAEYKRVPW